MFAINTVEMITRKKKNPIQIACLRSVLNYLNSASNTISNCSEPMIEMRIRSLAKDIEILLKNGIIPN